MPTLLQPITELFCLGLTECSLHLKETAVPTYNCAVLFRFDEVFPTFEETAVPTYYSPLLSCSV